jgi:hypothetical protein
MHQTGKDEEEGDDDNETNDDGVFAFYTNDFEGRNLRVLLLFLSQEEAAAEDRLCFL